MPPAPLTEMMKPIAVRRSCTFFFRPHFKNTPLHIKNTLSQFKTREWDWWCSDITWVMMTVRWSACDWCWCNSQSLISCYGLTKYNRTAIWHNYHIYCSLSCLWREMTWVALTWHFNKKKFKRKLYAITPLIFLYLLLQWESTHHITCTRGGACKNGVMVRWLKVISF